MSYSKKKKTIFEEYFGSYTKGGKSLIDDYVDIFKKDDKEAKKQTYTPSVIRFYPMWAKQTIRDVKRITELIKQRDWEHLILDGIGVITTGIALGYLDPRFLPLTPAIYVSAKSYLLYLYGFNKMCNIQRNISKFFEDDILIRSIELIDKDQFNLVAKINKPIGKDITEQLEHASNATLKEMIPSGLKNKRTAIFKFCRGKTWEYQKIPLTNVVERLEAVLKFLRCENKFVVAREDDASNEYVFYCKMGLKRLLRLKEDIAHKIGENKTLSIYPEADTTVFSIKKKGNKIYYLEDMISKVRRPDNMILPFIVGVNRKTGAALVGCLTKYFHTLIAGKTGSGKSCTFNALLQALMYWNQNIAFFLIDFKGNELGQYRNFKNCQFIENDFDSVHAFHEKINREFKKRVSIFQEAEIATGKKIPDIQTYNKIFVDNPLPYIVIGVDEANSFKQEYTKKEQDIVAPLLKTGLSKYRSTGIYIIHAVQRTVDEEYFKTLRTQFKTKIGHCVAELSDAQYTLFNKEWAQEMLGQESGEFILGQDSTFVLCKGLFIDNEHDGVYKALSQMYGGGDFVNKVKNNVDYGTAEN